MNLFNFSRDKGKKVFDSEAEASAKIRDEIALADPGVENLGVSYDAGVVSLSGEAASPAAMEKAVLMAGNVQGVSEVRADDLKAPPQETEVEYYEVRKGDSLWAIAQRFYGDGNKHSALFEANREVIRDPDLIYPGQKIRIPKDLA